MIMWMIKPSWKWPPIGKTRNNNSRLTTFMNRPLIIIKNSTNYHGNGPHSSFHSSRFFRRLLILGISMALIFGWSFCWYSIQSTMNINSFINSIFIPRFYSLHRQPWWIKCNSLMTSSFSIKLFCNIIMNSEYYVI